MFTLVGYTESQDSAVLVNIAALTDPHVRVSGDDIIVPSQIPNISAAYFLGPSFTQGQISSPSLRRRVLPDIEPADVNAEPLSPAAFHDWFDDPVKLDPEEALNTLAAEDGSGATRVTAMIWLSDGPVQPVKGDIYVVRVTNATTLAANAWTNGALTFTQTLPAGEYQMVGGRFQSAGLQAWRVLFVGLQWRPGAVGFDADGDLDVPRFRYGKAGPWGTFKHNTPPTVDFLSNSADSAQVGHLDLLKVG